VSLCGGDTLFTYSLFTITISSPTYMHTHTLTLHTYTANAQHTTLQGDVEIPLDEVGDLRGAGATDTHTHSFTVGDDSDGDVSVDDGQQGF
jgi:hypothetical protein